jgi:ribonuclease D
MAIKLYKNDLPDTLDLGLTVAIDTETLGLNPARDPLCVLQISSGDGEAHIVQLNRQTYSAPNLKKILADPAVTKIFHYARFDVAIIKAYLGIECLNVYCTRTASKLVRTYTDRHGLRDCCRELLGVELNKQQQSSDWGAADLTPEQLQYAANDVLYLHALKQKFDVMLERENRSELARKCFDFIAVRAELDLAGWLNSDIFEH